MTKSERAKRSHNPSSKAKQDASDQAEKDVAAALGGKKSDDNLPMDVFVETDSGTVGLEVKMLHDAKANKVHMRKDSRQRKEAWVKEKKGRKAYTVAIDNRDKFDGGKHADKYSGNRIYYREGVGAYRFGTMKTATSLEDLKQKLGQ